MADYFIVSFRQTSHVNLQETRAVSREIKQLSKGLSPVKNEIQICLVDSLVALGCIAKGRSSSFKLNGILRSLAGFSITMNFHLALVWIATGSNPADHPSRFKAIPPPGEPPDWMRRWEWRRCRSATTTVQIPQLFVAEASFRSHPTSFDLI